MKATIRFSISFENNSALRNKLNSILLNSSFDLLQNTASYETASITESQLATALGNFWNAAASHQGPGKIDHFWMAVQ
jgi:hypothetical protein